MKTEEMKKKKEWIQEIKNLKRGGYIKERKNQVCLF